MSGVNKLIPARTLCRRWVLGFGVVLSLISLPALSEVKFEDPLDAPAQMRESLSKRSLMAITHVGDRLVAVGSRGLIVASDDKGKTWVQAKVPVQSDLLAVQFPTATDGWAVGHDGVILHTADGGKTWVKQLDGRMAGEAFTAYYAKMGADGAAELRTMGVNYKAGAALPFLDVWFDDPQTGYVVGSYGMIAATHDGGKSWEPWLLHIDNKERLNLNGIRGIGSELYIVGEHGQIYRFDRARNYFTKTDTGYNGSFFGITSIGDTYIAYGLRGTIYRSGDAGKHWEALPLLSDQTIAAGLARADGQGFVLINAAAQFLLIDKTGKNVRLVRESSPMRTTGIVAVGADDYIVTGIEGVRSESPREAAAPAH
jgi:photosystem II stability/assembly factor-like uncharacterized protein